MCAFLKNSILWEYRREISYLELCFWRPLARFLVTGQKSPVPYHTFNDIYLSLAGNIKLWLLHGLTKICLHLSQNDLFYVSANKTCKAYEVLAKNLCKNCASFLFDATTKDQKRVCPLYSCQMSNHAMIELPHCQVFSSKERSERGSRCPILWGKHPWNTVSIVPQKKWGSTSVRIIDLKKKVETSIISATYCLLF